MLKIKNLVGRNFVFLPIFYTFVVLTTDKN